MTGCWATSNPADASALTGVDAVVGHHQDVALELDRLLTTLAIRGCIAPFARSCELSVTPLESLGIEIKRKVETATPAGQRTEHIQPKQYETVNEEMLNAECGMLSEGGTTATAQIALQPSASSSLGPSISPIQNSAFGTQHFSSPGATSLPLLGIRQPGRQRAFLKIQDGCDAHCTYCIIPTLRPTLWSKPVDAAVEEATPWWPPAMSKSC